jgi:uncharacterized protein with NRDE domain
MCLILLAWQAHPRIPLLIAANRDEFYTRPSAPAGFWEEAPGILAGRDLAAGGTWLGITRSGRFAAVTNFRDPASLRSGAPSRGRLVGDYLRGRRRAESYLRSLAAAAGSYNGFNLLVGDRAGLHYFSNRWDGPCRVAPGIHGLSNALLDTPWPKVERGRAALADLLQGRGAPDPEALFALLADRTQAPDEALPKTGVGLARERALSPLFIETAGYGTRSSTVLTVDCRGVATFWERSFREGVPWMTSRFQFSIKAFAGRKG